MAKRMRDEDDLEDTNDVLVEGNTLYVCYEAILGYLKENVPIVSYSKNAIGRYLRDNDIVSSGNAEKRTASSRKGKEKEKRRYIPINLIALKSAAEKY